MHHDTASIFAQLTNEQAGQLIKYILMYSQTLNENPKQPKKPSGFSSVIPLIAHSFEKQLERDFWKYQTVCERNEENGKKGGRPSKKTAKENENFSKFDLKVGYEDWLKIEDMQVKHLLPRKVLLVMALSKVEKLLSNIMHKH